MGQSHLADHYLAVELTDPVRPIDPMRRLREAFPWALTVTWRPPAAARRRSAIPPSPPPPPIAPCWTGSCRSAGATRQPRARRALLDRAVTDIRVGTAGG